MVMDSVFAMSAEMMGLNSVSRPVKMYSTSSSVYKGLPVVAISYTSARILPMYLAVL